MLGAAGDLGDVCTDTGTCTDTTNHVCDTNRATPLCSKYTRNLSPHHYKTKQFKEIEKKKSWTLVLSDGNNEGFKVVTRSQGMIQDS